MSGLYERLEEYSGSDYYPFHMPGHKRRSLSELEPYRYDITEIDGFDNLHEPEGILRIAMDEAAELYLLPFQRLRIIMIRFSLPETATGLCIMPFILSSCILCIFILSTFRIWGLMAV